MWENKNKTRYKNMPFWKCLKKKKTPSGFVFRQIYSKWEICASVCLELFGLICVWSFFFTISKQKPSHLPDRNTGETRTFTAFSFVAVIFTVFWRKL